MRSAIEVSGVASFSPKRSSRCTHSIGVSSPSSVDQVAGVPADRGVRIVVDLAAGDDRHPLVEQAGERADDARLGLAALAEEDDVVTGEQCVLQLRHDRVLVAEHAVEQRLAGGDRATALRRISSFTGVDDPARGLRSPRVLGREWRCSS